MREQSGDDPVTTARFRDVATRVLDALLQAAPEQATELGDHRYDDRLTDNSPAGAADRALMLTEALSALDDVDDTRLPVGDRVDLEILRTRVSGGLWELTELRPHERDPLLHLPGSGLYPLVVREGLPMAERLRALAVRLRLVPEYLATARQVLHDMPRVHVETAIGQVRGTTALLGRPLEELMAAEPGMAGPVAAARDGAAEALAGHGRWLESQLPVADGEPRLGEAAFAARLWYTLDTETGPDALLTRAESDLQALEEEISELASELAGAPPHEGQVREVLDRYAAQAPVTGEKILPLCAEAVELLTARVRELDLLTLPGAPVEVIEMPQARRGVAVAYCDAPGPLEAGASDGRLPAFFAVAPASTDWEPARVASFYREYNGHMLRTLAVHEAMPGHVVQLAHAARYSGSTLVRTAVRSGPFVEGWAVYAEELLAGYGLGSGAETDAGLRLHQLKMRLRSTINAVLDIRVHSRGMTEEEAMTLMMRRGHQEEGEAAGKWRRALLTSTQLSTYYVGHREVSGIVREVRAARPAWSWREVHDAVLAHGAPPPRHLRALLDLDAADGPPPQAH